MPNPDHYGPAEPQTGLTFEQSLAELQQIVSELEDGALGLEESLRRFEHGIGLLRDCYRTLEQAEQKIEILTGTDAQGNPVTAPFDATATLPTNDAAAGRRRKRTRPREEPQPPPQEEEEPERPSLF